MKQIKKSHLLLISSVVLIIATLPFLNFSSSSSTLNIWSVLNSVTTGEKHVTRLYELTLSKDGVSDGVKLNINGLKDQLNISNGIVVWNNSSAEWSYSSIWWWTSNKIVNSKYAWIAWWTSNEIESSSNNSVIWGWNWNLINWENAVIAWWDGNRANSFWVVIWWSNNTGRTNGVALWGQWNNADENSLVMWSWAGWNSVFAWNAKADTNSARIDAENWVLIWTTEPVPWVSLVVNWAVKINWEGDAGKTWVAWEIRVVSGCFYAFDWKFWHVISQSEWDSCTWFVSTEKCKFGNVYLQQWDQVTWYNATISTNCDGKTVVCSGGVLVTTTTPYRTGYDNPYCYKIN